MLVAILGTFTLKVFFFDLPGEPLRHRWLSTPPRVLDVGKFQNIPGLAVILCCPLLYGLGRLSLCPAWPVPQGEESAGEMVRGGGGGARAQRGVQGLGMNFILSSYLCIFGQIPVNPAIDRLDRVV